MRSKKILLTLLFLAAFIATVSAATFVEQFGITWAFDRDYQTGRFANGDYWVVGNPNVTIINISPQSIIVGGRTINGSMLNPLSATIFGAAYADGQGYDSLMGEFYRSNYTIYNESNNVARSNGAPIEDSQGRRLVVSPTSSLVSSISLSTRQGKQVLDTQAVLTILSSVPPTGSFRPPYSGQVTNKAVEFNVSDLDYTVLSNLNPVANIPSLSSVERYFERPWIDHQAGDRGEYTGAISNMHWYGRNISKHIGDGILMLNLDFSRISGSPSKETLTIRLVQLGIDNFGVVQGSGKEMWIPNGGIDMGRKLPIIFAGKMLNRNEMANMTFWLEDNANGIQFQEDQQMTTVDQWLIDTEVVGMPGFPPLSQYTQDMFGLPEWSERHYGEISSRQNYAQPDNANAHWSARYRNINATSLIGHALAVQIMGLKGNWKRGLFFDYIDRWWDWFKDAPNGEVDNGQKPTDFTRAMWEAYRPGYGCTWTSVNAAGESQYDCSQCQVDCGTGSSLIVIDHTAIDDFDNIPQSYIDKIKQDRMLVHYVGRSHATQMEHGLILLENQNSNYAVQISPDLDHLTGTNTLRVLRSQYEDNDWTNHNAWEGWWAYDYWSTETGRQLTETSAQQAINQGDPIEASFYGWSWDIVSPDYYFRSSIRSSTNPITFNDAARDLYLDAIYRFNNNAFINQTTFVYHTAPTDDDYDPPQNEYIGPDGWRVMRYNQDIRDAANANGGILFDQADIENYDNATNTQRRVNTWNGNTLYLRHQDYDKSNLPSSYSDHTNDALDIRKAKALWVLMARLAGWEGTSTGQCSANDISCGTWPNCQNCNTQDGCLGNDYRNYRCSGTSCTYTTTIGDPRCDTGSYLVYLDFEAGNDGTWTNYNPGGATPSWNVVDDSISGGTNAYSLSGTVDAVAGGGRLGAYSIIQGTEAADFEFNGTLRSTEGSGWRDLGIIFGYQNANEHYIVIFNGGCDAATHGIFRVSAGTKQKIGTGCSCTGGGCGTLNNQQDHDIKIVRNGSSIEAYFDNMATPIFTAIDSTYGSGSFGVGSINDTGLFDDIAITSPDSQCVDLTALLNHISSWKQGNLGMAPLMQRLEQWKAGTGC